MEISEDSAEQKGQGILFLKMIEGQGKTWIKVIYKQYGDFLTRNGSFQNLFTKEYLQFRYLDIDMSLISQVNNLQSQTTIDVRLSNQVWLSDFHKFKTTSTLCVSRVSTSKTWLWWFEFKLEPIWGNIQGAQNLSLIWRVVKMWHKK